VGDWNADTSARDAVRNAQANSAAKRTAIRGGAGDAQDAALAQSILERVERAIALLNAQCVRPAWLANPKWPAAQADTQGPGIVA